MVNYMVAVDDSENAKWAFFTALNMMKKEDELSLICVGEDTTLYNYTIGTELYFVEIQSKIRAACKKTLQRYFRLCQTRKITPHCIMGISNHVGELISQAADKKNVEILIIGRRGMSKIKRFFVGSTSKYVLEHAKCNVMVVKSSGMLEDEQVRAGIKQAITAEEKGRREAKTALENDDKIRKFHSELDKNIVTMAEEMERQARIHEGEESVEERTKRREAEKIGVIMEEEEERKRRIAEQAIFDDRTHLVEILDCDYDYDH